MKNALLVATAPDAFEAFLLGRGETLDTLTVRTALAAFVAFYRVQRFDCADLGGDEDMLLFQWGKDFESDRFTVDITRQLTEGGGEDDDMFQLRLVLYFAPDDLPGGSGEWCARPADVDAWERETQALPVAKWYADRVPLGIRLCFGCCG